MQVTLKIRRYNPEQNPKPFFQTYTLEAEPTDRVLDLLEMIKGLSRRQPVLPPVLRPRGVRLRRHAD